MLRLSVRPDILGAAHASKLSTSFNRSATSSKACQLRSANKKSSASAAGASAVRYDDVTQRAGSFITASQIKNRWPKDSTCEAKDNFLQGSQLYNLSAHPGSDEEVEVIVEAVVAHFVRAQV